MPHPFRLRCDTIAYRQGFIEVQSTIHHGKVNVDAWQVEPNVNLSATWVSDESISDNSITDNTELELTPSQARSLAESLLGAASIAEREQQEPV